jgi:hypothetical protein
MEGIAPAGGAIDARDRMHRPCGDKSWLEASSRQSKDKVQRRDDGRRDDAGALAWRDAANVPITA